MSETKSANKHSSREQQQHQLRTHTHGPTTQLDATVDFLRIIGSCNSSRTFCGTGLSQELASSLDAAYVTRLWGFSACTWYRQTYISWWPISRYRIIYMQHPPKFNKSTYIHNPLKPEDILCVLEQNTVSIHVCLLLWMYLVQVSTEIPIVVRVRGFPQSLQVRISIISSLVVVVHRVSFYITQKNHSIILNFR